MNMYLLPDPTLSGPEFTQYFIYYENPVNCNINVNSLVYDSVPHAKKWGKSPFFFEGNREVVVAEGCCNNAVSFSASIHSHTTWGGGAPGRWGRTGGLGPPAAPSRDPAIWWVTPAGPPHGGHISKL